jgi:MFS family permease
MTATTKKNERDQVALLVTYMNIVLYALCFQLQRPVEPFLVKSLASQADGNSADISKTYGRLQSFFNAIQTVGSPLVGVLLDKVGIRKASVLVFGATALSYLILACASDMKLLFLSKVPTVLQAAFLVAQATASTATGGDATARAAALGRMTTAYTVGATVGPALGGWFADKGDLYFSAKLAVLGSLVSVVLSWLYLPNSKNDEQKQKRTIEKNESFSSSLKASLSIGLRSSVWPLLTVKLLGGVVASIFSTALPLVLTQKIGFDASQLGLSMSASMFSVAVFSAVFMAPMANAVGPNGMTKLGLLGRAAMAPTMAIIFATTAVDHSNRSTSTLVMQVAATSVLHALSAHSLATGLTTQTTGAVANDEQGALLGLEHSLFSLARIAGPSIGTALLASVLDDNKSSNHRNGFWHVATCCAVIDVLLVVFAMFVPRRVPAKEQ